MMCDAWLQLWYSLYDQMDSASFHWERYWKANFLPTLLLVSSSLNFLDQVFYQFFGFISTFKTSFVAVSTQKRWSQREDGQTQEPPRNTELVRLGPSCIWSVTWKQSIAMISRTLCWAYHCQKHLSGFLETCCKHLLRGLMRIAVCPTYVLLPYQIYPQLAWVMSSFDASYYSAGSPSCQLSSWLKFSILRYLLSSPLSWSC